MLCLFVLRFVVLIFCYGVVRKGDFHTVFYFGPRCNACRVLRIFFIQTSNNTGLPYSAQNAKLLYRAILWTAGKEDMDKKSYCTNPLTEAHFYGDRYAVTNNTSMEQTTVFYDMDGVAQELVLKPYEILWVQDKNE